MAERDYDVVCLSHLRWDWVWQRPQHLLSRCARGRRVFYVQEAIADGATALDVEQTEQGVSVVTPHTPADLSTGELDAVRQTLLAELFLRYEIDDHLLWVYSPMASVCAQQLKPIATVYDCMDELSLFAGAPPELRQREARLLETADLVFTGGESLYEAKRELHPRVHCFPSSVDVEHFGRARKASWTQPCGRSASARRCRTGTGSTSRAARRRSPST